jgi:hypothetical protein
MVDSGKAAAVTALSVLDETPLGRRVRETIVNLVDHPIYRSVTTVARARVYMSHHVWCVWDFMSLVKSIQRGVTCTDIPWLPPSDTDLVAYINEILLSEESDEVPPAIRWGKAHASHFEIYLRAMYQAGADVGPMELFMARMRQGQQVAKALVDADAPPEARAFVSNTLALATGPLHRAVGAFCIGREGIIPEMFSGMLSGSILGQNELSVFRWYLARHIQVDSDSHGPLSVRLFKSVVNDNSLHRDDAFEAALGSLLARQSLLDAALRAMLAAD